MTSQTATRFLLNCHSRFKTASRAPADTYKNRRNRLEAFKKAVRGKAETTAEVIADTAQKRAIRCIAPKCWRSSFNHKTNPTTAAHSNTGQRAAPHAPFKGKLRPAHKNDTITARKNTRR